MASWYKAVGAGLGFYMGGTAGALIGFFLGRMVDRRRDDTATDPILQGYYDTLKVSPTAQIEEIKQSYRTMVKQYHPDLQGKVDEQTAGLLKKKMATINEAYSEIRKARDF